MNLFINIKVEDSGILDSIGSFGLAPVRYFSGRSFTAVDKELVSRKPSFENPSWLKTVSAVVALVPGFILGAPFRLLALCFQDVRNLYTKASKIDLDQINNKGKGTGINLGQIGPVKMVAEGVFTAEGITPSGEKIYFAMESKENEKERNKWNKYQMDAFGIINGGDGSVHIGKITELASIINDESSLKKFLSKQLYHYSTETCAFWQGDPQRFEQLKDKLRNRKIDGTKAEEIKNINQAMNGLSSKQTHMVYASKSPILGRVDFDAKSTKYNWGGYIDRYGDIIMSVGSTIRNYEVENRGIFRNPLSIIEGGNGGIAMMLHSFTGMVVKDHFPSIETFVVSPFGKMAQIAASTLPKEKITIDGIRGDHYVRAFENNQAEKTFRIPIDVLANFLKR